MLGEKSDTPPGENQSVMKIIDALLSGCLHSCILWSLERHKLLSIFIMLFTLLMIDHSKLTAKLNMIIYRESPAWSLLLNNEVDLRNGLMIAFCLQKQGGLMILDLRKLF